MSIFRTTCDKCKRTYEMEEVIRYSVGSSSGYLCKTCVEALKCFVKEDYILPAVKDEHKETFDQAKMIKYLESERQKAAAKASLAGYSNPKLYKTYSSYEEAIEKFLLAVENMAKETENGK